MKSTFCFFLLFGAALTIFAQAPDTLWTKMLSGQSASDVFPTSDGGFVISGYTTVSGHRDFYMAKTDDQGEIVWEKTFGSDDRNETLTAMIETSDGGYLLAGNRAEDDPYYYYSDIYIIKTDADGNQEWYSIIGEGGESETPNSVAETSEGGFIMCGSFWYDGYNVYDVVLTKVNQLGAFEWKQYYNFEESKADHGLWVETAPDGGFLVTGDTQAFTTNYDYDAFILKTTPSGTVESFATIGEAWPMYEGAYRLLQCSDGSKLICGYQNNDGIDNNWYVVKTGANGWTHVIGGTYHDKAYNACETADGGYAVTGTYYFNDNWNCFVVRYSIDGDTLWTKMWGDSDHSQYNYDIKQLDDGGFITVGSTTLTSQTPNIYLTRLAPETVGINDHEFMPESSPFNQFMIQPNPFYESTTLSFNIEMKCRLRAELIDVTGAKIKTLIDEDYDTGKHELIIDSEMPNGIYFCRMQADGFVEVKKLIRNK